MTATEADPAAAASARLAARAMDAYHYDFVDLDFRPAPAGWRALFLLDDEPGAWIAEPVAGWLIQAETRYWSATGENDDPTPLAERPRRVVAAIAPDGYPEPLLTLGNFWQVRGPGESDPTAQETADEVERHAARDRRRATRNTPA